MKPRRWFIPVRFSGTTDTKSQTPSTLARFDVEVLICGRNRCDPIFLDEAVWASALETREYLRKTSTIALKSQYTVMRPPPQVPWRLC